MTVLQLNIDGTRVFQSDDDRTNEQAVADEIAAKWNCEVKHFAALSPVDWYFVRSNRLIGIGECKCRTMASDHFSTSHLSVRKWLALELAAIGLNVPAAFFVKYTDGLFWIKNEPPQHDRA